MRRVGKVNPAWRLGADMRIGRLQIRETRDPAVNRHVRTAELYSHELVPLLRPLRDVILLQLEGDCMVLAGYEHHPTTGSDHPALVGQVWAVHPVSLERYREWFDSERAQGRDLAKVPHTYD